MTLLVLFGGMFCAGGLWWCSMMLFSRRRSLDAAVSALRAPVGTVGRAPGIERMIAGFGTKLNWSTVDKDLAVIGRSRDEHMTLRVIAVVVGGIVPPALITLVRAAGAQIPLFVGLLLGVAFGFCGWLIIESSLRDTAGRARRDWRRGLSNKVDLIRALVAAGTDVRAAAIMATRAGTSPLFSDLRQRVEVAVARQERLDPVFADVGERIGVVELTDLASLMDLVTSGGIDPRDALEDRAAMLRSRELSEVRKELTEASEHMNFPLAIMAFAFAAFVAYPAMMIVAGVR
jgi:tight adherence protein C